LDDKDLTGFARQWAADTMNCRTCQVYASLVAYFDGDRNLPGLLEE
jgi:hypothetical protein